MVLELVGGAVVGAIAGELLKAVLDAKQKVSAFQPALARLESTLKAMIPRLDQISRLNSQLNLHHTEMEELVSLIINGRALVVKCSKISTVNLVKKLQYSKELLDLDNSLFRYFVTILPLDHLKDTKEILVVVKELQMKLVGDHKDGGIHQSESAGTHKEDSASAAPEVVELLLVHANDAQFQGLKLFREGLYKEALLHYDLALHLAPDQMPATKDLRSTCYANRAKCFLKLGKHEDTIRECNKALELNPDYVRALLIRGEAHEKLQHFDEAIADMEILMLKLDPTDVQSQRTKEFLEASVKRLQKKPVGDEDRENCCRNESGKPKEESTSGVLQEAVKFHKDSTKEFQMKLVNNKADGGICNKDADDATSTVDVRLPNGNDNEGVQESSDSAVEADSGRESESFQDGGGDAIKSTNPASTAANSNQVEAEWMVEEYEPGVYIYTVALCDGAKDIKRVRFSRRLFGELQVENWWCDNREKVYERYNVRGR